MLYPELGPPPCGILKTQNSPGWNTYYIYYDGTSFDISFHVRRGSKEISVAIWYGGTWVDIKLKSKIAGKILLILLRRLHANGLKMTRKGRCLNNSATNTPDPSGPSLP